MSVNQESFKITVNEPKKMSPPKFYLKKCKKKKFYQCKEIVIIYKCTNCYAKETYGYLRGLKIAWVGDGNNIIHSFMMACPKVGIDLRIATPKGYECFPHVVEDAVKFSSKVGSQRYY